MWSHNTDFTVLLCIDHTIQSAAFNLGIMFVILVSSITISLETTTLVDSIPTFFIVTDYIYLFVFLLEFILKVGAPPPILENRLMLVTTVEPLDKGHFGTSHFVLC